MRISLAFFTCGFFMAIIETRLYSHMLRLGLNGSQAALAFTIYGIMSMAGPVFSGFLCSKTKCKWVLGTLYGLRTVAVLLFLLIPKNIYTVYGFVIVLGLLGSATVPPTTNLISKLYGFKKIGMLLGVSFVFHQIGSFISTWLGGIIISNSGSFNLIWVLGGALAGAAAILSYTVNEKTN